MPSPMKAKLVWNKASISTFNKTYRIRNGGRSNAAAMGGRSQTMDLKKGIDRCPDAYERAAGEIAFLDEAEARIKNLWPQYRAQWSNG